MNVLVLGGNGFIGSHVVDALLNEGHAVRVFDRGPEQFRAPLSQVDYRIGDFNDSALLAEALTSVDVVYHLISSTVPSTSNLNPVADVESNLIGTLNLLELMRKQEVQKIVYLSSGGTVYGVPDVADITEDHPLRPISSYGIVKVAIENYLFMEHKLYGLEYKVIRASNPYGPRQGHSGVQGVIGTFLGKIQRGASIEVWGDGSIVRDFIYVEDLASLCTAVLTNKNSVTYNGGAGVGLSINDILKFVEKSVSQKIDVIYKEGRSFDVPRAVLDCSKAQAELPWAPAVGIEDGIGATWDWVNRQSDVSP